MFYFNIIHSEYQSAFRESMFFLFIVKFLGFNFYSSLNKVHYSMANCNFNFYRYFLRKSDHKTTFFNRQDNLFLIFLFKHWMLLFLLLRSLFLLDAIKNSALGLQVHHFQENYLLYLLILKSYFILRKYQDHPSR